MTSRKQLEGQWNNLKLTEEEEESISLEEEISKDEGIKVRRSIIGKLCMDRSINQDVLKTTMRKVWRTSKPALFKEVGRNLFTISLATEIDKQRVMNGRP